MRIQTLLEKVRLKERGLLEFKWEKGLYEGGGGGRRGGTTSGCLFHRNRRGDCPPTVCQTFQFPSKNPLTSFRRNTPILWIPSDGLCPSVPVSRPEVLLWSLGTHVTGHNQKTYHSF